MIISFFMRCISCIEQPPKGERKEEKAEGRGRWRMGKVESNREIQPTGITFRSNGRVGNIGPFRAQPHSFQVRRVVGQ